jgi:hypothetical protein
MSTTMPTTTPATKPLRAHHEVTVSLQGTGAVPSPIPPMAVGETVLYKSKDGEVRILFPARSPFRTDNVAGTSVPGSVILTLVSDSGSSTLECRCFLTLPNGQEVGWSSPTNEDSGGQHKVTPPSTK